MSLELRSTLAHPPRAARARAGTTARELPHARLPRIVLVGTAQLAALLALSGLQWQRDALTYDFSIFGQAGWLIAHGHLDPHSSLIGMSFIRNDAELIFWPLALLAAPFGGSPFLLLVLEDAALAATSTIALLWAAEVLEAHAHRLGSKRQLLWLLTIAAVALDPWCYATAMFPFHLEAFAGLFTVLAGRQLWHGARWPFLAWCAALACTGTAGLIETIGFGAAALLVVRRRVVYGVCLVVGGLLLLELLMHLGLVAQNGSGVGAFGYLAPGRRHPGLSSIMSGLFTHIPAVARLAVRRLPILFAFLIPLGLVGVVHRVVIAPVLAVFLPPLFAGPSVFFRAVAAFQVWPVLLLVLVGTVEVLARVAGRVPMSDLRSGTASASSIGSTRLWLACLAAWLTGVAFPAATTLASVPGWWVPVTPAAAGTLQRVARHLSGAAEVIVSQGVIGRFAARRWIYAINSPSERIPIHSRDVVFVFTNQGILNFPPAVTTAMASQVRRLRGATTIARSNGVVAIRWRPPRSISSVALPVKPD